MAYLRQKRLKNTSMHQDFQSGVQQPIPSQSNEVDPQQCYDEAQELSGAGKREKAVALLEKVTKHYPNSHSFIWRELGYQLKFLDRHDEAIKAAKTASRINPNCNKTTRLIEKLDTELAYSDILQKHVTKQVYSAAAKELGELGKSRDKIALLTEATRNFDKDIILWNGFARSLSFAGDHKEAVRVIDIALDLDRDDQRTIQNADRIKSFAEQNGVSVDFNNATTTPERIESAPVYSKILERDVTDREYIAEAKELRQAGKKLEKRGFSMDATELYKEGIALMEEATDHFPYHSRLLKHHALCLSRAKHYDSAWNKFDEAIEYATSQAEGNKIRAALRDAQNIAKRYADANNTSGWGNPKYG